MSEALTYAFADAGGAVCGVARLGVAAGRTSGLAIVFRDGALAAVQADGEGQAGLTSETLEPDRRWRVRFDGDEAPFALEFEAVGEPLALGSDSPVGRAGGMEGADRVCRVVGEVAGAPFEGRGQRGESSGEPDWEQMALARTVTAWFDDGRAISGVAIRPAGAESHADELAAVYVVEEGPALVSDARISTTYDAEGRQRAAGLELHVGEDEYPLRVAGEVVAGTSLDLRAHTEGGSELRLDCAFFRWRTGGREGVGRYDILRRTT